VERLIPLVFVGLDQILRPRQLESNKKYSASRVRVDSQPYREAGNIRQPPSFDYPFYHDPVALIKYPGKKSPDSKKTEYFMSGWKARIGYLSPSVFETPSDWDLILPKGFTVVASGLNVQAHTTEEFNKAIEALEAGLGIFSAEECDVILLAGITLGTQRGYQAEQEVVSQLSQRVGLPVSTAMNAGVEALRHLKAKTIVIATAYMEKINQSVKRYYEDAGFQVLGIAGLEVKKPVDQVKLPDYASYKVAKGLFQQHPAVDAILIQGRWRSVAWVEELERDSDRSVISSTAASLWWVLRTLRMQISIEGYGRLLR
jgi:maleate isomerase